MKRLLLVAACVLAGCGGGSNHDAGTITPPPVVVPPVTLADRFFSAVQGLFGKGEDGEPVAVDAVAATAPDNTEPEPVK